MQERCEHTAALQLEHVWGLTVCSGASSAGDCVTGCAVLSLVELYLTDDTLDRWRVWTHVGQLDSSRSFKGSPAVFVLRRGDIQDALLQACLGGRDGLAAYGQRRNLCRAVDTASAE